MSSISREDVQHIAMLARLMLAEDEIDRYRGELDAILRYIEKINALDTCEVPPMSHAVALSNVTRPDAVEPSLPLTAALANAPDPDPPFFRVPKVVD